MTAADPGQAVAPRAADPGVADPRRDADPVLAEVVRSGFVESVHRGRAVALAPDGTVRLSVGDVAAPVFGRSSVKPLQATGMVRAGLGLTGELLALGSASHSGEAFHRAGVERILAGAGLAVADLACPPDLPGDEAARTDWLRAGHDRERVAMNCSGKHAAMLATCVAAGWPTQGYRNPDHPLQQALLATVAELAGGVPAVGVDGCGAPVFATSLVGLADAGRSLVTGGAGEAGTRVADAFRAHPRWTSGTHRAEAALMELVPGLLVKGGAEGVQLAVADDGTAVAVKVDDGAGRASVPVLVAALRAAGVAVPADVGGVVDPPVLGGGRPVGEVRAVPAW